MSTAASTPRKFPRLGISPEKGDEILGVMLAALVVLLAASLASYHPLDPSVLHQVPDLEAPTRNFVGPFGAQIADLSFSMLGLGALLIPLLLAALAWRRLKRQKPSPVVGRGFGVVAVLVAMPAMLALLFDQIPWRGELLAAGGAFGKILADVLIARLNIGGAFVVLTAVLLIGVTLVVQSTLGELLTTWRAYSLKLYDRLRLLYEQRRKEKRQRTTERRVVERHLERMVEERGKKTAKAATEPPSAAPSQPAAPQLVDLPVRVTQKKGEGHFAVRKVSASQAFEAAPRQPRPPQQENLGFVDEHVATENEIPPINLLRTEAPTKAHNETELVRLGDVIRTASMDFGVEGSLEGINPGPVITVYEFQPAPGVKVSRIVGLQDDLALALKAESVRIDRIPGRSTLGIEVPNPKRSIIHLGQLLDTDAFRGAPSPLTMAIGVDLHGRPYFSDLASMPHLLVAGATGAGKSVGLQSMITSILYKATRDQVQFIFIDPKRIELGVYSEIPHLKAEVVVDPKKAANALRWAVSEMERRYRLLAEVHVRSIAYYNRAIRDPKERERLALKEGDGEFRVEDLKPLPYYVIIIDELADLMMVSSSDVETSIARLAQMARAVGIHLIVATQRPSVDVLTGTIKANFPCRLAYATATRHDSRTILDQIGAEKLLGKGDALFMPPGTSRIMRLHGAYISEQETASLIRWLKRRGKPDIDPTVVSAPEDSDSGGSGGSGGGDDDLFEEAARMVVAERQGSASFLQRRMRVGFSRAARLIDMMEADGLLGPSQGSKPREVLVPVDYFDEIARARAATEE